MTNPTSDWDPVPVTGKWLNLDGSPKSGTIKFTLTQRVIAVDGTSVYPRGGSLTAALDAFGAITAQFPASDDPNISPTGWTVKVEELLSDNSGQTYYVTPQLSDLPGGLNLNLVVVPDSAPTSPPPVFMRGTPGGLAALDADGDVINADGEKVTGGGGTGTPGPGYTDAEVNGNGELVLTHSVDGAVNLGTVKGEDGDPGPANTLAIGTVSTGAAGSSAAATVTGTAPSQTLNLTIPRGDAGTPGGAGPANSLAIGTVTTGTAGSSAAATVTGTAPSQTLNLTIPRGNVGAANSLAIGTVTTGAAGSSASAAITGAAPSQTLSLTIPKGDKGDAGQGVLVLGPTDPVPGGTPAGTVILRTA